MLILNCINVTMDVFQLCRLQNPRYFNKVFIIIIIIKPFYDVLRVSPLVYAQN